MLHPLEEQVRRVKRRARLVAVVRGLLWMVLLTLAAALLLAGSDVLIRFEDRGLRILCSAAVVAAAVISFLFFLLPAFRFRRSDIQIAQWLEQRFPQLGARVSSAIVFLRQDESDPLAGSASLRRAVIAEASAAAEQVDGASAVKLRPLAQLGAALLALLIAGTALLLVDPPSTRRAASRLAMPWRTDLEWPRRNDLYFVQGPRRIAAGEDFEAELVDRNGQIPRDVTIEYWFDGDDADQIVRREMAASGPARRHRLAAVRRSFKFRAVGGDDDTKWRAVEVVEPPRPLELSLAIHPPAYTGLARQDCDRSFRAWEGSRMELRGKATKPIQAARIHAPGRDEPIDVDVLSDGRHFALTADAPSPWIVEESGEYWLELVDESGVSAGMSDAAKVQAVADAPPSVLVSEPAEGVFVTPQAVVPLDVLVDDDLLIREVQLRYVVVEGSLGSEGTLELYRGPEPPRIESSEADPGAVPGDRRRIVHDWRLGLLTGLAPGDVIEFRIAASDYRPEWGESSPRRITIISSEDMEDRVARGRGELLRRLAEVLRLQRDARGQTRALEIFLEETSSLGVEQADQLSGAELNQRRVRMRLALDADSVLALIRELQDAAANNALPAADFQRRMEGLRGALAVIAEKTLPVIELRLLDAVKLGQERQEANIAEAAAPLASAGVMQDEVIRELEALLGELSEWNDYRRFERETSRFRRRQEVVARRTEGVRIRGLGRSPDEMTPSDRAELRQAGEEQAELAREFEKLLRQMEETEEQLREGDPAAAAGLAAALEEARRLAIGGQMHEGARRIDENDLGEAVRLQAEVVRSLEELEDALAGRREQELDRLVEQLREAADELEGLRTRQEGLAAEFDAAAGEEDPAKKQRELERLIRRQEELKEQTGRLARRLQRMAASAATKSLSRAADSQSAADQSAAGGDAGQAAESAERARQALEQAEQELAEEIAAAEQELFEEQLARLEDQVAGLILRQRNVIDETARLDELHRSQGKLSRAEAETVLSLAGEQRGLAGETSELVRRLIRAEAFVLALQGAQREMLRAAGRLDRLDVSKLTLDSERAALVRLEQIVAALAPSPPADGDDSPMPPSPPPPGISPAEAAVALTEIKLLVLLQEEINRRTKALEELRAEQEGRLSPEQEGELADLAAEQGRLADMILGLTAGAAPN